MTAEDYVHPAADTAAPALGPDKIELPDAPADLALIDLNTPWVVDRDLMRARSTNSPFDEQKMQGRVLRTIVAGETVFEYGR